MGPREPSTLELIKYFTGFKLGGSWFICKFFRNKVATKGGDAGASRTHGGPGAPQMGKLCLSLPALCLLDRQTDKIIKFLACCT